MKKIWWGEIIATLVGTIIGAGVFVLPATALKSGLALTLIWLVFLTLVIVFLHLAFGEVVLRTKKDYRLPGYVGHYLGKPAKKFLLITTFLTFFIGLLIYLLLGTRFLNIILQPFNISEIYLFLLLWFILTLIILWNHQSASKINFYLSFCLIFLFILLFFFCFPHINPLNFSLKATPVKFGWLIPYGVIFFALNGLAAIPEAIKTTSYRQLCPKRLSWAIIIGTLIPAVLYLLFIIGVLGTSGINTTEEAIKGLIPYLGNEIITLGAFLGFLAVTTSYLIFGSYIKNSLLNDFVWPKTLSYSLVALIPLVIYFLGLGKLIILISFTGALLGGFEGIMMLFTLKKAKEQSEREPEYKIPLPAFVFWGLICCFLLGALTQVFIVFGTP